MMSHSADQLTNHDSDALSRRRASLTAGSLLR